MLRRFQNVPPTSKRSRWDRAATSGYVKVFGRRPARMFAHGRRPASENLEGTKPREGARIRRCRALSYGDLGVCGPQGSGGGGWREWWRGGWRSDEWRFRDVRGGV